MVKKQDTPSIVYAGDRDISVQVLKYIIEHGIKPVALMVSEAGKASHADELVKLCSPLDASKLLIGNSFRSERGLKLLKEIQPDYILCIHFPYIVPEQVLSIPKHGVINLHPAYLPFNRGWHTPTWAIWEQTIYGATLHFMNDKVDMGDIIHQKKIKVLPNDTANSLYKRVKELEFQVFKEAWHSLKTFTYVRKLQPIEGTAHDKKDIASIQFIDLNAEVKAGDFIRRLRALTTNNIGESAYFQEGNQVFRVQINIAEEQASK